MILTALLATAGMIQQPVLRTADIAIALDGDAAVVEGRFVLADPLGRIELVAIRFGEQMVTVSDDSGFRVESDAGSWRLAVDVGAEAQPTIHVRYRVEGRMERIPILAPPFPTDPLRSSVEIHVSGAPEGRLSDVFPRMTRRGDGTLEARPANLPSFVRIPGNGGRSFNWFGDVTVIALLVIGAAWWGIRMRRRPVTEHTR